MKCKICGSNSNKIFNAIIINKYKIDYFKCDNCGFLQVEHPYWLEEAYKSPINNSDTGLLDRNIYLSRKVSIILYFLFNKDGNYLDYGGGYGIFTRLMRDIGFNFYHYDPYTQNLFAKGFEYDFQTSINAITTFETFEHFLNPLEEIEKMLRISKNIIFTTELLPQPIPKPHEWWYYGLEHGQHISFYSVNTLEFIAQKCGLNFLTNGRIHLFSEKKSNAIKYKFILKMGKLGLFNFIKLNMNSKTNEDMKTFQYI